MAKIPSPRKSGKGTPPPLAQTVGNLDKPEPTTLVPLNFKVAEGFHKEFKAYAARQGISMVELLKEGFRLVKAQRGGD